MSRVRLASLSLASAASFLILGGADGGCFPSGNYTTQTQQEFQTTNQKYTASGLLAGTMPRPNQPIGGKFVSNISGKTATGGGTSFGSQPGQPYSTYTDSNGTIYANNIDLNTNWTVYYNWEPNPGCNTSLDRQPTLPNQSLYENSTQLLLGGPSYVIDCAGLLSDSFAAIQPQFALSTALPASLSEAADTALTTAYGSPTLNVYGSGGALVATSNATSIASDQVTATFPYPLDSYGDPLQAGLYGTAIVNHNSDGSTTYAGGADFVTVGRNATTYPGAFGVAAANEQHNVVVCHATSPIPPNYSQPGPTECDPASSQYAYPIVTLPGQNEVSLNGTTIPVGGKPTAVVAYGTSSSSTVTGTSPYTTTDDETGTGYAIVTNTGGNSVSVLDIQHTVELARVTVGSGPVAAVVSPDASKAYVANYADGTVSLINLSSFTQSAVTSVGGSPAALDVDTSGNVWVGGAGYVAQLDPNSLAVKSSVAVSGNVSSLALSKSLNEIVATVIANNSGSPSGVINYSNANAKVVTVQLVNNSQATAATGGSAQAYAVSSTASQVLTPSQVANATVVSANYGNALTVSLTPNGFVVTDLTSGSPVLSGNLPAPPRALAVDPDYGYVFVTMPDTNSVVTIPLPPIPTA